MHIENKTTLQCLFHHLCFKHLIQYILAFIGFQAISFLFLSALVVPLTSIDLSIFGQILNIQFIISIIYIIFIISISNNDETAYLDEVERLTSWCQDNCLSLNVSKTKELIVDFRKRQQRPYTPLMISGTPVERVSGFKYLGVNISEDLTWTTHIQTPVKKARQRLYHLRQLRKFRVSPAILKTFYSGAIESALTQCISVWYSNSSNQDCKALQRVVRLAERISGSTLPSLQDIYLKCCKSRAAKIIEDSNHPGNRLFILLPSGKRFRSMMAKTERLRRSFFLQAIRLLNSISVS